MQITVELPPDIASHPDPGKEALEALIIEGYRSKQITLLDAGRMLNLSRIETEDFLARHLPIYDYTDEELQREAELLKGIR